MKVWVRIIDIRENVVIAAFAMDLSSGTMSQGVLMPATANASMKYEYRFEMTEMLEQGEVFPTPVHTSAALSPRGVPYRVCDCKEPSPDFPYHVEEIETQLRCYPNGRLTCSCGATWPEPHR